MLLSLEGHVWTGLPFAAKLGVCAAHFLLPGFGDLCPLSAGARRRPGFRWASEIPRRSVQVLERTHLGSHEHAQAHRRSPAASLLRQAPRTARSTKSPRSTN